MLPPPVWPVVLAGFTAFINLYATQALLPLLVRVFDATPLGVTWTVTATTLAVAGAAPMSAVWRIEWGVDGSSSGQRPCCRWQPAWPPPHTASSS